MAEEPIQQDWEKKVEAFDKYITDTFNMPIIKRTNYPDRISVSCDTEDTLDVAFYYKKGISHTGKPVTVAFFQQPRLYGIRCSVINAYSKTMTHVRKVALPNCHWEKADMSDDENEEPKNDDNVGYLEEEKEH